MYAQTLSRISTSSLSAFSVVCAHVTNKARLSASFHNAQNMYRTTGPEFQAPQAPSTSQQPAGTSVSGAAVGQRPQPTTTTTTSAFASASAATGEASAPSTVAPGTMTSLADRYAEMLRTVSQRLTCGKSAIHGQGAFAKMPIKSGGWWLHRHHW